MRLKENAFYSISSRWLNQCLQLDQIILVLGNIRRPGISLYRLHLEIAIQLSKAGAKSTNLNCTSTFKVRCNFAKFENLNKQVKNIARTGDFFLWNEE